MAMIAVAIAGTLISGAMSYNAKSKAKQAEKHRARLQGINNNIQKESAISNSYIQAGNMRRQSQRDNSTQDAVVSAQGRRTDSGSAVAIKKERKRLLDKNTEKTISNAELTGELLDINTLGANSAAESANDARDIGWAANQVSSLSSLAAMDWS